MRNFKLLLSLTCLLLNFGLFSDSSLSAKTKIENLEQSTLAPEKISQIQNLKPNYESRLKTKKSEVSKAYARLRKELKKDTPELENLKSINEQLHALKKEAKEIELEYQYELSKILSADQRKELKKALKLKTKKKKSKS